MIVFETERLIVREWNPDNDAEQAYRIYGDPEVQRFIGRGIVEKSVESQRQSLANRIAAYRQLNDGTGFWALEEKSTGIIVGSVIVKWLPDSTGTPTQDLEIGWHLAKAHWGKGYATEAGRRAAQYAFEQLGQSVIYAVVRPGNDASVRVTQRIGMHPKGQTTKYYATTALLFELHPPNPARRQG